MKLALLAVTEGGYRLAEKIAALLDSSKLVRKNRNQKTSELFAQLWPEYDGLICIMAAGIVVRSIASLLKDKSQDPCVIVIDEKGKNVISLLSGHIGGGNSLTLKLAELLNANPVITTASDTLQVASLDLWAKQNDLLPPLKKQLTALSSKLVNSGSLQLYTDVDISDHPKGLTVVEQPSHADFVVSHRHYEDPNLIYFRPRNLVVGTGCNRGTGAEEFESALTELFNDLHLSISSIRNVASIDKKNDEAGLLQFAASHGWRIDFYDKTALNSQKNLELSLAALKAVGAIGVAEPACLLSAKSNILLSRKRKWKNVTMAVAQVPFTLSAQDPVR